jgi:hypothetical protein
MNASPRSQPNAYVGFSSASLATFLVVEAHSRLGLDLTLLEASFIVGVVTTLALALGKKYRDR